MNITDVKVFPVNEEKLKAYVSVVLDSCFIVSDIKIIQGGNGLFISMPSKKKKNGEFKDVAHPLNRETRELFERRIIGEYEKLGAEPEASPAPEPTAATAPPAEETASSHSHH
jgi:stage V sporulation protein G